MCGNTISKFIRVCLFGQKLLVGKLFGFTVKNYKHIPFTFSSGEVRRQCAFIPLFWWAWAFPTSPASRGLRKCGIALQTRQTRAASFDVSVVSLVCQCPDFYMRSFICSGCGLSVFTLAKCLLL